MRWAVCDKFREYLCNGRRCSVYTDNNPLKHILTKSKIDATSQRWCFDLADFNIYVNYKPGVSNVAQCLLVAHHGYWVPCGSRLNCAGSRSRLEPQRYSVHDPSACGYALALTNPITCCLAGRCIQAKARRRELRNQTTLSQPWVK